MRYHNITKDDMLNGEGLRVVLWVSGCSHHCEGCHNAVTWDPDGGLVFDAAEERGVNRGETLKLIMLVQKKVRKGESITKIADDLVEDEIVISPIYKMVKEYPEDTERDIYQRLN